MSRWLQAAKTASPPNDKIDLNDKNAPAGIKSNKSILSERGRPEFPPSRLPALGSSRASVSPVDVEPVAVQKSDAELYADALRTHGPTSYGAVGVILGWGMARASRAETVLRNAGRIQYDNAGRGCLVEHPSHHEQQSVGEKS